MTPNCNILIVVGTRPNFIKIAPITRELDNIGANYMLVHTGQHYDENMSDVFFKEFSLRKPDLFLNIGSGTQIEQTAKIMKKFEKICISYKPEFVIVVGDVTSTVAAALVVCKMPSIKLIHVEAGGRSFDKTMPEEINRIITDTVSDYLFAIESDHVQNLLNEGIDKDKIFLVGDNLIDNLLYTANKISRVVSSEKYILVTVHRQNNTDDISRLKNILTSLDILAQDFKIKFPIHPRTNKKIKENGLEHLLKHVVVLPPLGYTSFVTEMKSAAVVLTDSGGITIEAAVLGVPCIVLRKELERNFLVEEGLSVLVDNDVVKILKETRAAIIKGSISLNSKWSNLLDGKASCRMIKILLGDCVSS